MTILRLLNVQGIAGLAVSLCLAALLLNQKGDTRHWKKESAKYQQLYRDEQSAFAATVANYRDASDAARAANLAAAQRVAAEQKAINQRSENELESRLADARALAERLRNQPQGAAGHPRRGAAAAMSSLPSTPGSADQAAGESRLPDALIATEQAIQLDELIKWVRAQAKVDNNGQSVASSPAD
jgi:hypothetical protein